MSDRLVYGALALTGGGDALDGIDGALLQNNDVAIVFDVDQGKFHSFVLDSDSGLDESSPNIISPDDNAGDKRWIKLTGSDFTGDLDDISDGVGYSKVVSTALTDGEILLSEALGDLDDIADGASYGRIGKDYIDGEARIILVEVSGDFDDISDGATYGRVLLSDINAGHIRLSEATGDLDDIVDGANYGKVDVNDITSGHIILSTVSGDLDDVDDGDTYGKVAVTSISAGLVVLAGDGDSHVVLDGPNGKIYVNNSTFGNVGIQLDYNAGTPRFYCGDGSNNYFKFDGTNVDISSSKVDALVIKSGGNILIETGGDLVLIPDNSSPAKIDFANESRDAGQSFFIQRDVTYGYLYIVPETDNLGHLWLGSGPNTWGDIRLYANNIDITSTHASYDLSITSAKDITLTATSGEISLTTSTIDVGSNGLTTLAKSGQGLGAIICYLKTSAPTPVSGMLCGYDGSGWNPHSTGRPGLTFYDGGTWRQVSA